MFSRWRAERKTSTEKQRFWRVTHPYPATHAAKASFTAALHHFVNPESGCCTRRRTVNERAFFPSAKGVTLRGSPLSLAKTTKTCSSLTISAAGDLSAAAQHLPDIERRRCRSILEAGLLHWFLPRFRSTLSDEKNGCSALDAPCFAGRKEWPLKRFSSSYQVAPWSSLVFYYWKIEVEHRIRTETVLTGLHRNELLWLRVSCTWAVPEVSDSLPRPSWRSCALCGDEMVACWKLNKPRMRWNTAGIDRKNVLARARCERTCCWFWNETWNF